MPITVYTFLQQVSLQLWDNTAFFLNAPHVLMSKTRSADLEESHYSNFEENQVAHLPFKEYSEEYPHTQYTLGMSGRDVVGPDWYVNVVDNTENHGSKGGAEPCFGEIIVGRETIDLITRLPMRDGVLLENPVSIVKARILDDLREADGGQEALRRQQAHTVSDEQ